MANFFKQAASNMLGSDKNPDAMSPLEVIGRRFEEGTMRFPMDLGDNGRPIIHFSCTPDDEMPSEAIFFPIPQGITYGDGASYTTFDVGIIGEFAQLMTKAGDVGAKGIGNVMEAAKQVRDMASKEFDAIGTTGASILAARKSGFDNVATNIEFANKQVMNPRTNSAFSGNTIRNFQFDFKMIGKSDTEVKMIDKIQQTFRTYVYAAKYRGSSFMLSYPPKWVIKFVDPAQKELNYIPKIYTCYLTGVNTVINPSSNTFRREDLSPYEIDMSLQFQETKILTRDEFLALENKSNRENETDEAFEAMIEDAEAFGSRTREIFDKGISKTIKAEQKRLGISE